MALIIITSKQFQPFRMSTLRSNTPTASSIRQVSKGMGRWGRRGEGKDGEGPEAWEHRKKRNKKQIKGEEKKKNFNSEKSYTKYHITQLSRT